MYALLWGGVCVSSPGPGPCPAPGLEKPGTVGGATGCAARGAGGHPQLWGEEDEVSLSLDPKVAISGALSPLPYGRQVDGGGSYPPVPEQQPVPLFQLEAVRVPEEGTQGPRLWALLQPMSWGVGAALASPPRAADLEVKSPLPARTFSEAEDLCLRLCVPARLSRTAPEAAPSTRGPSAPFSEVVLGPSRPRHVRFGASCTPAGALGPGGARRGFREAERKSWCTGHVLSLELGASDHRGAHLAPQGGGSERRPRLSGPAVPGDAQCGCPPDCDAPSPGLVRPREVSQASGHSPRLSSNYGFAPSLSFWEEIC